MIDTPQILGIGAAGALWAVSAILPVVAAIWDSYREDPKVGVAQHLNRLRAQEKLRLQARLRTEELALNRRQEQQHALASNLLEISEGVKSGRLSGAQVGVEGGGLPAWQRPMVEAVASKIGIDPKTLVAKFDPAQSNIYIPKSRRGSLPRPSKSDLLRRLSGESTSPPDDGAPAQLDPNKGFM